MRRMLPARIAPRSAAALAAAALAAALGCKSSGSGTPSGSGGSGGGDGAAPLATLFTDPAVPHCDKGPTAELHGTLGGQQVDWASTLVSNLDPFGFQLLEVVNGVTREDVALTWSQPLAESTAIPLTGLGMIMREGQPYATQQFCITAGEFGSPAIAAGATGRTLLYRITGALMGSCSGPEIPVALAGCAARSSTYFPIADAGAGPTDGAADANAQCTSGDATADAGSDCNSFPITGAFLSAEAFTQSDGGAIADGGVVETAMGGTLVDGDYDLVRYRTTATSTTRRTLRILSGGTRIEWAAEIMSTGGSGVVRYDTDVTRNGNAIDVSVTCGTLMATSYGYTASGTDLLLFSTDTSGNLINVYTYRRTCRR
jgi:hypothetical protein